MKAWRQWSVQFEIIGEVTDVEPIAVGKCVRIRQLLVKRRIKTDDPDLLTPRKIYEVIPDTSAEKSDFIRVIDNEGEDYLYPASCFVFVRLPNEVEKVLQHVS